MRYRHVLLPCLAGSLLALMIGFCQAAFAAGDTSQSILHTLDYVAVDYPAVVENGTILDQAEYVEQQEFTRRLLPLIESLAENDSKPQLTRLAAQLVDAVNQRQDGEVIRQLCAEISTRLIGSYPVETAPRKAASVQRGAQLFSEHCSSCHGASGMGDGIAARGMEPAPSNFHDRVRQGQRNPYSLFTTVTLGVDGTAMQSYAQLNEEQRWDLAFYLSTLYFTVDEQQQGQKLWESGKGKGIVANITELSRATPDETRREHGNDGVAVLAYLRSQPAEIETGTISPLEISRVKLQDSLSAYQSGNTGFAYELAVNAYLEGFELAEAALSNVAPEMKLEVEREMGLYRQMVKEKQPVTVIEEQAQKLLSMLDEAQEKLSSTELSTSIAFVSSLIILLREGLEAILVLAAIAAFLTKTDRKDVMPYMHAGWVGALLLGFLTWLLAEYAFDFSGASREMTEGVTGLFAAAMLVYIGFWLHNHTHAERWKAFIHSKLHGVTSGTVWSLTIISFIAVYREVVETVLFYKTLWIQTEVAGHGAILGGLTTAAIILVLVAWAIFRFSVRLPLALFFRINSALLYAMAVVFAGKGITALQEAGHVSMHHISFPRFDWLGIYPSMESIGLQLMLLLLAAGWLSYERIKKI